MWINLSLKIKIKIQDICFKPPLTLQSKSLWVIPKADFRTRHKVYSNCGLQAS